jgi:hypothetical protein
MIDDRPIKVMVNGYFYKDYKRKSAAIKYANMLKNNYQYEAKIEVVTPIEIIEI